MTQKPREGDFKRNLKSKKYLAGAYCRPPTKLSYGKSVCIYPRSAPVNTTYCFPCVDFFSRAHTIVGVTFTQKRKNDAGEETAKTSLINLVDLAGRCVIFLSLKF